MGFAAQSGHAGGLVVGRQRRWRLLAVEGVDLGADGGVLVGDDPVGDAGIDEGHLHLLVAEQCSDGFQAHAAVDGLGGQGVPQPVRVDTGNASSASDPVDDAADAVPVQRSAVIGDQAPVVRGCGRGWPRSTR